MNKLHNEFSSNTGIAFHHSITSIEELEKKNANLAHAHPQFEVYYLVRGEVYFHISGQTYKINPGSLFLINAFEGHSLEVLPSEEYERYVCEFTMDNIPTINGISPLYFFFEKRHSISVIPKDVVDSSNILEILKDIEKAAISNNKFTAHIILSDIIKLLCTVNLINNKQIIFHPIPKDSENIKYELYINQTTQYITANIDTKLEVEDIARHVNLSKSYLQHIFKKCMGCSISTYVFKQKMNAARYMLTNGKSFTETAESLGYEYYSTFSADYKKMFGVSPKNDIYKN